VPLFQRLALVLFAMCGTALGIRLFNLYQAQVRATRNHSNTVTHHVNGTKFFLDIGSGNSGLQGYSPTAMLEGAGWKGVCADPFPDADRSCTAVDAPVTPLAGQSVTLRDCTPHFSPLLVMLSTAVSTCPTVERSGVSIADVLKLSQAPHVIDFVSLNTEGTELAILQRFPFQDFCVQSWTVKHGNKANATPGIQNLLKARHCRVTSAGASYFARCPCDRFAESLLTRRAVALTAHTAHSTLMRSAPTQQRKRKSKQGSMVSTLTLPEDNDPLPGHSSQTVHAPIVRPPSPLVSTLTLPDDNDPLPGHSTLVGIVSGMGDTLLQSPMGR